MFDVGDKVRVTDSKYTYNLYENFFKATGCKGFDKWYRGYMPDIGEVGVVVDKAMHPCFKATVIYVVETDSKAFLISEGGLKLIEKAKFKVGDKVEVVQHGLGCNPKELGKEVTITEVGCYGGDEVGYKVHPAIGNTKTGGFNGFIGEQSFKCVCEPLGKFQKFSGAKFVKCVDSGWDHFQEGSVYPVKSVSSEGLTLINEMGIEYTVYTYIEDFEPVTDKSHPHKELILQWVDGAQIQVYSSIKKTWVDVDEPRWKHSGQYRVKPTAALEELEKLRSELEKAEEVVADLETQIADIEEEIS